MDLRWAFYHISAVFLVSRAGMPPVRNVFRPHALSGTEQKTKNLTTWLMESTLASALSILEAQFLLQTDRGSRVWMFFALFPAALGSYSPLSAVSVLWESSLHPFSYFKSSLLDFLSSCLDDFLSA